MAERVARRSFIGAAGATLPAAGAGAPGNRYTLDAAVEGVKIEELDPAPGPS